MKELSKLVNLSTLGHEKLVELFRKNDIFRDNVTYWREAGEIDYIREVFNCLDAFGTKYESDFGLYTRTMFSITHTVDNMRAFLSGLEKAQKMFCFLPDSDNEAVEKAEFAWSVYANNIDEDKEEIIVGFFEREIAGLETRVCDTIRKIFEYWEKTENMEEAVDDFADCAGEDIWYNPDDGELVEVSGLRHHNYY